MKRVWQLWHVATTCTHYTCLHLPSQLSSRSRAALYHGGLFAVKSRCEFVCHCLPPCSTLLCHVKHRLKERVVTGILVLTVFRCKPTCFKEISSFLQYTCKKNGANLRVFFFNRFRPKSVPSGFFQKFGKIDSRQSVEI